MFKVLFYDVDKPDDIIAVPNGLQSQHAKELEEYLQYISSKALDHVPLIYELFKTQIANK